LEGYSNDHHHDKTGPGRHYTLDAIRDEAKQLVDCGTLDRCQSIGALCGYIAAREWRLLRLS
jgi:hypothetical protein